MYYLKSCREVKLKFEFEVDVFQIWPLHLPKLKIYTKKRWSQYAKGTAFVVHMRKLLLLQCKSILGWENNVTKTEDNLGNCRVLFCKKEPE